MPDIQRTYNTRVFVVLRDGSFNLSNSASFRVIQRAVSSWDGQLTLAGDVASLIDDELFVREEGATAVAAVLSIRVEADTTIVNFEGIGAPPVGAMVGTAWSGSDRADQALRRGDPFDGDAPVPSAADLPSADPGTTLVGANTTALWRERALNLVEELAGSLQGSADPEERAAGELALAAVRGLRAYVSQEIADDRREAWGRLFQAVAEFIPRGREGLNMLRELRGLARTYGISVP